VPGRRVDGASAAGSKLCAGGRNTRYILTRPAAGPGPEPQNVLTHLVVGKVIVRTGNAAREPVGPGSGSAFVVSTPTGLALLTGGGAVVAYDPAANRSVVAGLPASGGGARGPAATWVPFATATAHVVAAGTFITHTAGQIPSAAAPISSLPLPVQQQLTTATNSETAGSAILTRESVIIVGPRTIHQVLSVLASGLPPETVSRAAKGPPPPGPNSARPRW
jgi:hypothetical protein